MGSIANRSPSLLIPLSVEHSKIDHSLLESQTDHRRLLHALLRDLARMRPLTTLSAERQPRADAEDVAGHLQHAELVLCRDIDGVDHCGILLASGIFPAWFVDLEQYP